MTYDRKRTIEDHAGKERTIYQTGPQEYTSEDQRWLYAKVGPAWVLSERTTRSLSYRIRQNFKTLRDAVLATDALRPA